jgi:hypothetical protein
VRRRLGAIFSLTTAGALACGAFGTSPGDKTDRDAEASIDATPPNGEDAAHVVDGGADARFDKRWTFEDGVLVHEMTGADSGKPTVELVTINGDGGPPLVGNYSARTRSATNGGWLHEQFLPVRELTVAFVLRVDGTPAASDKRIVRIGTHDATGDDKPAASVHLYPDRTLQADGKVSSALAAGQTYRVEVRYRAGKNGRVEAYLAAGNDAFGTPFVASDKDLPDTFDSVNVGIIDPPSTGIDIVFDEVSFVGR